MGRSLKKGFGGAVILIAALAGALAVPSAFVTYHQVSPTFFRDIAQAGVGLLIAYSVMVAAAERSLGERSNFASHQDWLGFTAGLGVCSLIGIGLGFCLAEHRAAGHANILDWLGLWWAVASIGMLGLFVATQPITNYEWRRLPAKRRWRLDRVRSDGRRFRGPTA